MSRDELIARAADAARHAHAPYSRFGVGAALLLDDGRVLTGCNFENASYGLALCAETVAIASANAAGALRQIVEIAVVGGPIQPDGAIAGAAVVRPCGRCRQVIHEAGSLGKRDIIVHCASADGNRVESHQHSQLLPLAFGPADLGIA